MIRERKWLGFLTSSQEILCVIQIEWRQRSRKMFFFSFALPRCYAVVIWFTVSREKSIKPSPTYYMCVSREMKNSNWNFFKYKKCVPVGCIPPACWPYLLACTAQGGLLARGVCLARGGLPCQGGSALPGGLLAGGGWVSQHALRQTPPVNRITHTCNTSLLRQLSHRFR